MIVFLVVLLAVVSAIALAEGCVIVGFLLAADTVNHDPATVDLEDA